MDKSEGGTNLKSIHIKLKITTEGEMKKVIFSLMVVGFYLALTGIAMASNTGDQSVSTTVSAINEVNATGGTVTLDVIGATAGSDPNAVSDTATADLLWTTNETGKKIVVSVASPSSDYTLTVVGVGVTGTGTPGTLQSAVTLSDTPQDLITAIATTAANCSLTYTLSSTAAQGTTEAVSKTVTFTITATT